MMTLSTPQRFALTATVVGLALSACSSSPSKTAAPAPAASSSAAATSAAPAAAAGITIKNFQYAGKLTVKAGEQVTVTNLDSAAHTLTDTKTHLFDSGNAKGNGGTATFTAPKTPGSYAFGCTYHPKMAGTLVVVAG